MTCKVIFWGHIVTCGFFFTGEMSMEELLEKYRGAYASDFEEPSASPDSSEESEGTEEEAEEETEGEDSADDSSSSSGELKFMMIVVLSKVPTSVPVSTRVGPIDDAIVVHCRWLIDIMMLSRHPLPHNTPRNPPAICRIPVPCSERKWHVLRNP